MPTPETPFDFNSPQSFSNDPAVMASPVPRKRPGGLTAVCVIAIILGVLGLGSSLMTLASLAMQSSMEKAFKMPRQPGMPDNFVQIQEEMQKKIMEVNHRYSGLLTGIGLLNLVIASCLLAGGIMAIKMKPNIHRFLVGVFLAAIVFEVIAAVVGIYMQLEMSSIITDFMSKMVTSLPKGAKGGDEAAAIMMTAAKVGVIIGMVFSLGWALAKMIFYGVSASYLRRPNIRRLFGETPPEQM
jgi:hypothetical protein